MNESPKLLHVVYEDGVFLGAFEDPLAMKRLVDDRRALKAEHEHVLACYEKISEQAVPSRRSMC